ncbi:uncharacterized protein LOC107427392 [Ziziphus jujuba]|uniref:Uncharacterized protein LOC107427392 n=2 Tax=Ziziphus jujuba TaxID=326968 RepID=A0ABM3IX23_ZIZJJ|nr:uncharacterized protein LOC107427392 [Ziziphus jujuba]
MATCSGLIRQPIHAKLLPVHNKQCNVGKFNKYNAIKASSKRIPSGVIEFSSTCGFCTIHAVPGRRDNYQSKFDDDLAEEPFWITLVKDTLWGMRSLFFFLVEQPSQLKYIEWPGFRTTLKTATLTLVLVALLIIALSSVDSALSYLLALLLRRTP